MATHGGIGGFDDREKVGILYRMPQAVFTVNNMKTAEKKGSVVESRQGRDSH